MRRNPWIGAAAIALLLGALPVLAADPEGPAHSATAGLDQATLVQALQNGSLSNQDARKLGLLVFSTPFNTYDGLGDGPWRSDEPDPVMLGHRPTLQGNGTFLRVNGLDAQSCNECHTVVSNRTLPPTTGIAGVGGVVQNAIIMPSLIDVADSFDNRVVYQPLHVPDLVMNWDGVADYNGRFANPPFLFGGGGTELLAKEMTYDLQQLLAQAEAAPAGTVISLDTHGVSFGTVTSLGGTNVQIDNQGIDTDLVVKPFGRKGENFSMRDFDRGAMQFHFGIQPQELFLNDPDNDKDGVSNEVSIAEMSVLHIFDVNNPKPRVVVTDPAAVVGAGVFATIGCTYCHRPFLKTTHRVVPLSYPEIKEDPTTNIYYTVNLVQVGFAPDPFGPGVIVPFYSDLKRHYMGPGLEETFERAGEIPQGDFVTARLWGIADTAPYLHDGRATTLYQAISMHGGEAQQARNNFMALPQFLKNALVAFLKTQRAPSHPNEDLLPIQ
jgi:hypothetical protein